MEVIEAEYLLEQGRPLLALTLAIASKRYSAQITAEPKPGMLRSGLIFLGSEFSELLPPIQVPSVGQVRGFTNDRAVFRLAIAFGLEVWADRFQPGSAVEVINRLEFLEMGDRLEPFALPGAPRWRSLLGV